MPTRLTNVKISLLPEGRHPAWLAITPDNTRIVVPNQDTHNVSVIELASRSVIAVIRLRPGGVPWAVAITPDSKTAWVTNSQFNEDVLDSPRDSSFVSVIDLEKYEVVGEVRVGAGPNGIVADRQGRFVYVANARSDTVSQIDCRARTVVREIAVGHAPADVAVDASGSNLVVTNFGDASLSVIDTASGTVLRTVHTGTAGLTEPHPEWGPGDTFCVTTGPDGVAYASNWRTHTVVAVRISDGAILTRLSVLEHPCGVQMSPDGRHVFVSSDIGLSVVAFEHDELRRIGALPSLKSESPASAGTEDDFMSRVSLWGPDSDNNCVRGIVPLRPGAMHIDTSLTSGTTAVPAVTL